MVTKMMIAYVDVLGPRAKVKKPCHLEGTRLVFKDFAIHIGLGTKNHEILLLHFLQQPHDKNDVT
jgi:hypothetical protein